MLSDKFDALHARSSAGMGGNAPLPLQAALGPRSCSGEGEGGNGRADPLRGGGDKTVICCGERSDGGGGARGSVSGGSGKTNAADISGIALCDGGTVAIGVSPSRWRKSASGAMCAMRSPIGVTGTGVGISSTGRTGWTAVVIIRGGGVVERPDGALRIRRRCLSDVARE